MLNTEKALRYPITTLMVFTAVILLGFISFSKLPISLLPDIEFPEVTIVTEYKNASAREIEHLVTKQIEEAVASVSGVKDISSISSEGVSIVKVKFTWGKNMDFAAMEIREKVDLIKGVLPQDVKKSIVLKYNPSETPIMSISISSLFYNKLKLREIIEKEIKPGLERIDGVAAINITGGLIREIQINIDNARLYANNLSIPEVIDAINYANYNYPAGNIKKDKKELIVRVLGEFQDVNQVKNLVVGLGEKNNPVYLYNIAEVEDSFKEQTSVSHYNGIEDINLSIQKEAQKNSVNVCETINDEVSQLNQKFEGRLKINVIYSQAEFIKSSISNLISAAILGGIIAFIVLMFFIQNLKSSLIIIISIPVSIMAVFIFMFLKKINLNMISMGGIAIGIGMLVDNSIVVLESINRKITEGLNIKQAALQGTLEVTTSVTASTITSIIVFLPIIFVKGIAGSIFGELAFTISIALLSSLIVSLTLIPLLFIFNISFLNKFKFTFLKKYESLYIRFENYYYNCLKTLLPYRKKILYSGPIILLAGLLLLLIIKKDLLPVVDKGEFRIKIEAAAGTTLEHTKNYVKIIEQQLLQYKKQIKSMYTMTGFNEENIVLNQTEQMKINKAVINVLLQHGINTEKFIKKLKTKLHFPQGLNTAFYTTQEVIPGLSSTQKKKFLIAIRGKELTELRTYSDQLIQYLSRQGHFSDLENESGDTAMEYQLKVDRETMSSLGLNIKLVAETLQALIKGKTASYFREHDDEYDIKVRLREQDRINQNALSKIFIKNHMYGINIPLSAFIEVIEEKGESTIFRENQERVMYVSCNSVIDREQLLSLLNKFQEKTPDYRIELSGMDKETRESINNLIFAFILSIILIYMILASQFESLLKPLIIMFATPLTITGAGISLLVTNNSINVISAIGLIMLSGVVVNNSIVLFEYFEILKKRGYSIKEAVLESCRIRLKPIMMTTLTTVLGLIPLAIGLGNGSELQSPMAITVIGGLVFASLLTLIYIPFIYLVIEEKLKQK